MCHQEAVIGWPTAVPEAPGGLFFDRSDLCSPSRARPLRRRPWMNFGPKKRLSLWCGPWPWEPPSSRCRAEPGKAPRPRVSSGFDRDPGGGPDRRSRSDVASRFYQTCIFVDLGFEGLNDGAHRGFSSVARPIYTPPWRGWFHPNAPHYGCRSRWELSCRGFSSVARPIYTPPWRGWFHPNAPHSGCRSRWELSCRGFFERFQAQRHTTLAGSGLPQRPSLWLSVTMRAKLQGLFSSVFRPRDTLPWRGRVCPNAPHSGCRSRWELSCRGFFERFQAQRHTTLAGSSLPQRPSLWLSVRMRAKLQGLFRAFSGPETHYPGGVGSAPTPLTMVVGHDES